MTSGVRVPLCSHAGHDVGEVEEAQSQVQQRGRLSQLCGAYRAEIRTATTIADAGAIFAARHDEQGALLAALDALLSEQWCEERLVVGVRGDDKDPGEVG